MHEMREYFEMCMLCRSDGRSPPASRVEAAAVLRADSVCHSRTVPEWKSAAEECGVRVERRQASSVWRLQEQIYDTSAATSA